ncbi:MAG: serine/threonine protein kinase, partial [Eubacterium sp.]|nr:serine/threonine protein kinase [Eubacterium sp.]
MNIEAELALSYYKEIADINKNHEITLVQHVENKHFFVKKELSVYNESIYAELKNHPLSGLPTIRELEKNDDTLIIIEDYINGETLEDILQKRPKLSEDETKHIILQLCDTVTKLHSLTPPIIHRDIKPSNVMITPEGNAILLDMNAARFDNSSKDEDTRLLGTKGYAAPEQYGFGPSGVSADIYALGMLMNTMLTGNISREQIHPGHFSSVIKRCLKLNPSERYASVAALKAALTGNYLWTKYLPPGFRSLKPTHMLLAIIMYMLIIFGLTGVS